MKDTMKIEKHLVKGDASAQDVIAMFKALTGRTPTKAEEDEVRKLMSSANAAPRVTRKKPGA